MQSSFPFNELRAVNAGKTCEKCGADKETTGFQTACRPCRRAKDVARAKRQKQKQRENGTAKDVNRRRRKAQRARWIARGLTSNGTPRKNPYRPRSDGRIEKKLANALAKLYRAWRRRWLRETAPTECVLAWYAGTGKPWNSPRLNDGERFAMRYRLDDTFRAREVIKAQYRKERRAERIARASDGSVTPAALGAAFAEAKFCAYCMERFESSNEKTADHVEPLYLGGAHSMDNIVIACLSCNSSKGRKRLLDWLTVAPQTSNWLASTSSRSPTYSA